MVGKGMEAERAAAMRVLRLRRAAGGAMATTSGGTITVADVSELESCASCAVMGSSSKDSSMESSEEEEVEREDELRDAGSLALQPWMLCLCTATGSMEAYPQ